jgi:hypothetical protein
MQNAEAAAVGGKGSTWRRRHLEDEAGRRCPLDRCSAREFCPVRGAEERPVGDGEPIRRLLDGEVVDLDRAVTPVLVADEESDAAQHFNPGPPDLRQIAPDELG